MSDYPRHVDYVAKSRNRLWSWQLMVLLRLPARWRDPGRCQICLSPAGGEISYKRRYLTRNRPPELALFLPPLPPQHSLLTHTMGWFNDDSDQYNAYNTVCIRL